MVRRNPVENFYHFKIHLKLTLHRNLVMCGNHGQFLRNKSVVAKAKDHQKSNADSEWGNSDSRTAQSNLNFSLMAYLSIVKHHHNRHLIQKIDIFREKYLYKCTSTFTLVLRLLNNLIGICHKDKLKEMGRFIFRNALLQS